MARWPTRGPNPFQIPLTAIQNVHPGDLVWVSRYGWTEVVRILQRGREYGLIFEFAPTVSYLDRATLPVWHTAPVPNQPKEPMNTADYIEESTLARFVKPDDVIMINNVPRVVAFVSVPVHSDEDEVPADVVICFDDDQTYVKTHRNSSVVIRKEVPVVLRLALTNRSKPILLGAVDGALNNARHDTVERAILMDLRQRLVQG